MIEDDQAYKEYLASQDADNETNFEAQAVISPFDTEFTAESKCVFDRKTNRVYIGIPSDEHSSILGLKQFEAALQFIQDKQYNEAEQQLKEALV